MPVRWPALVLAVLVALVFGRSLGFAFIGYDDPLNITDNPLIADPVVASPLPAWRAPLYKLYIPLSYTVWYGVSLLARDGFDASGHYVLRAWPFHAANVLLHLSAVLSVLGILRVLGANLGAALLGAALFAVHPLQVEAVCWVTGLRDLLGGALALAALRCLLAPPAAASAPSADAGRRLTRLWRAGWPSLAATVLGCAAMLAKPGAAALPLMAIVLLPLAPIPWRRACAPLAAWVLAAIATLLISHLAQPNAAAAGAVLAQTGAAGSWSVLLQRALVATFSSGFYLGKLLWPTGFAIDYGFSIERVVATGWRQLPVAVGLCGIGAWLGLLGLAPRSLLAQLRAGTHTRAAASFAGMRADGALRLWLLVAGLVGLAGLLPALGLVPFDFQKISTVADRYAYLALLGPSLGVAAIATWGSRRWRPALAALPIVAALLALQPVAAWRSSTSLFAQALVVHPESVLVHHSQGAALLAAGDVDAAVAEFARALRLHPGYEPAVFDLALAREQQGQYGEALALWQSYPAALTTADVGEGMARCQRKLGDPAAALATLRAAAARFGERASGLWLQALVAADLGRNAEADNAYRQALALAPVASEIRGSYGDWLAERGDTAGATREYQSVLAQQPGNATVLVNYGILLAQKGDAAAAERLLRAATDSAPKLLLAHLNLAQLLATTGRLDAARREYQLVLAQEPDNAVARTALTRLPDAGGTP